jgi:hypothetical protein
MSGQILVVYDVEPKFPATDQHPSAVRSQVGSQWVDAIGGTPTQAEVNAFLVPIKKSAITEVQVDDFRTANATQATMVAWPLAVRTLYAARFTLMAISLTSGECHVWHAVVSAKRVDGGALMVGVPAIAANQPDPGASGWGVTADVSGNSFRVRVTGQAGQEISWSLLGEVVRSRPTGLVD